MYNGTSANHGSSGSPHQSSSRKASSTELQKQTGGSSSSGLAQRYDEEKERITKSCFAKMDENQQRKWKNCMEFRIVN